MQDMFADSHAPLQLVLMSGKTAGKGKKLVERQIHIFADYEYELYWCIQIGKYILVIDLKHTAWAKILSLCIHPSK